MAVPKIGMYIEQRALGLAPSAAALAAGYSAAGIKQTTSRLEARADVKQGIKAVKARGVRALKSPTSKRQYRSVADEPEVPDNLEPWKLRDKYDSPLELLRDVMNNPKAPGGLRIQCAKDALPYCHARKEGSKGDEKKSNTEKAAKGKFGTQAAPLRRVA